MSNTTELAARERRSLCQTLFNGEPVEGPGEYPDVLTLEDGGYVLSRVSCISGVDGTCNCVSHDRYHDEEIDADRAWQWITDVANARVAHLLVISAEDNVARSAIGAQANG